MTLTMASTTKTWTTKITTEKTKTKNTTAATTLLRQQTIKATNKKNH